MVEVLGRALTLEKRKKNIVKKYVFVDEQKFWCQTDPRASNKLTGQIRFRNASSEFLRCRIHLNSSVRIHTAVPQYTLHWDTLRSVERLRRRNNCAQSQCEHNEMWNERSHGKSYFAILTVSIGRGFSIEQVEARAAIAFDGNVLLLFDAANDTTT